MSIHGFTLKYDKMALTILDYNGFWIHFMRPQESMHGPYLLIITMTRPSMVTTSMPHGLIWTYVEIFAFHLERWEVAIY